MLYRWVGLLSDDCRLLHWLLLVPEVADRSLVSCFLFGLALGLMRWVFDERKFVWGVERRGGNRGQRLESQLVAELLVDAR